MKCLICQIEIEHNLNDRICGACKTELPLKNGSACKRCGEPIDGDMPPNADATCGECRINPPPFNQTVFSLYYRDRSRDLIHQFKFRGKERLSTIIARLMIAGLNRELDTKHYHMIIPVPLHFLRLFKRGYNQSYLLGKEISEVFDIPLRADIVSKIKNTPAQMSLSKAERRKSINKAFKVKLPESVKGKKVLLVDDLMTTGATMREVSKVLKRAGAAEIACAVAARA